MVLASKVERFPGACGDSRPWTGPDHSVFSSVFHQCTSYNRRIMASEVETRFTEVAWHFGCGLPTPPHPAICTMNLEIAWRQGDFGDNENEQVVLMWTNR